MKVLIIQTAYIGDVILATPIIEKLKEHNKDCTIDFLLRKGNETLLTNHPHINKVFIFDKKNKKYRNLISIIKSIRSESYDYIININRFFTAGLITILSGAKVKIGFNKSPFSFLFTKSVKHLISQNKTIIHEVDRNLSLIKSLANNDFTRPKLYPSEEDYQKDLIGLDYICIAPATVWFTKQFPTEKWIELIHKLPPKYSVYLIGGAGDYDLCNQIQGKVGTRKIENLAGKLTFLQSATIIKNAKMTYANDSTPVHLASSMNAPIAVIYCSTLPEFGFGPLSDNSFIFEVNENLDCRPCGLHGKKHCKMGHFKCSDISIERIIKETNV
jgi:ADP-heptose:LPS heptosyltransferase